VFTPQETPPEIKESIDTADLSKKIWLYDSELDAGILRTKRFRSDNNIGNHDYFLIVYRGQRIEFEAYTEARKSDEADFSSVAYDISYEVSNVLVPCILGEVQSVPYYTLRMKS
jgi:hypothetical protein